MIPDTKESIALKTQYIIECVKPDGSLRWKDGFSNLVFLTGLDDAIDKHFKAAAYTSAWYVGLTSGTSTFALTDTAASHPGWAEVTTYSEANRQALTLGAILSGSANNASAKAVFSINGTITIGGAFLTTYPTKNIPSGTVYGGGAFSGGNRAVQSGDTLNVTVTLSATN